MKIQNKPIIFLPIESTPRELDYKLNIARIFCMNGYDAIIGNPPFIRDELKYKNYRGIFLEKGMNPDPEYYQKIIDKKIKVYCLSDEGASIPSFSVTFNPAIDSLKKAEKIFLWGNFQKNDLIARNSDSILTSKYHISGYPGFDLSCPKYKPYHSRLKPDSIGSNYILVNTNFASFNGHSEEEIFKACSAMSPETKHSIKITYEKERISFVLFIEWLEKIIEQFPNEKFLIRPHPMERQDTYNKMTKKFKNLIVSRKGNVNQAIHGAKLVIHNDCTTAMQSYLADIPVISLANSDMENISSKWALEFGAKPENVGEAISLISYVLKEGRFDLKLIAKINSSAQLILNEWFYNVGTSTEDIVQIMLSQDESILDTPEIVQLKDSRSLIQKCKNYIRKFLPLHYKVPVAARVPLEKFTKRELINRLNLLNQIDNKVASYTVKKLYPNTYLLSQKI